MAILKKLFFIVILLFLFTAIGVTSSSQNTIDTKPEDVFDTSWIPTSENSGGGGTQETIGNDVNAAFNQVKGVAKEQIESPSSSSSGESLTDRNIIDLLVKILAYVLVFSIIIIILFAIYRKYIKSNENNKINPTYVNAENIVEVSWAEVIKTEGFKDPSMSAEDLREKIKNHNSNENIKNDVDELTDLFIKSRYSDMTISKSEEQKALELSNRIILKSS